jgi:hypothetical protein
MTGLKRNLTGCLEPLQSVSGALCNKFAYDCCAGFSDFYVCSNCNSDDDISDSMSVDWCDAAAVIALDNITYP